jgi:hypothetical protein
MTPEKFFAPKNAQICFYIFKIPAQVMKISFFHYGWLKKTRFQMGHVGKQCT